VVRRFGLAPGVVYLLKSGLTHGRSALWRLCGGQDAAQAGLRILYYPRIADDGGVRSVPAARFRVQMEFLAAEGYAGVDVSTVARLLAEGAVPPHTIGVSFDDAYATLAEHALPQLERHGFKATVYAATGAGGRMPLLSWEQAAEFDGGAFVFGAHTSSRPDLRALREEDARAEIEGSKQKLEERLGRRVETFSYPAGLFGERERRLVADAGFSSAVTVEPGLNLPTTDRLALYRIQVDARDRLLDFRAKVAGAHDSELLTRRLYRRIRYGGPEVGSQRASVRFTCRGDGATCT